MRTPRRLKRQSLVPHVSLWLWMLGAGPAHGIEAPRPQAPTADAPAVPTTTIQPSDEKAFYAHLQRVAHARNLRDLGLTESELDALAAGSIAATVQSLSARAAGGDERSNIALIRLQHWCSRAVSSRQPSAANRIKSLPQDLPAERSARLAGVLLAEEAFLPVARAGCQKARFDYGAIEDRLREAADAGSAPSAAELAQFTRDTKKREALLQLAVEKQYAPAMHALASSRLIDVQRAERTEDVGSIRELLKRAARTMPKAKLDLANCMALGCDGHPADAQIANAFGVDAAREGEPTAFPSMMQMPWGRRMSFTQLLAWQYFGDRLNEAGCSGESYVTSAIAFARTISALERGQEASVLAEAQQHAEALWRDYSARAMKEQRCGASQPAS